MREKGDGYVVVTKLSRERKADIRNANATKRSKLSNNKQTNKTDCLYGVSPSQSLLSTVKGSGPCKTQKMIGKPTL